ncbi:MBL fold metallo-hydrolase [Agromyces binzhouensis]|uniref:MBL fold metallo-hydrolase n=1 Tax=Agromyces binzhouensis TaxID=1817495 RepID=UPI003635962B
MRLTRIGGPTVLVELDGWRVLVDPTFDAPGRRYDFGWGTSSRKTIGPALGPDEVGPVDLVLVSHDHHADNLDDRGRTFLRSAGRVVTTRSGGRRLGAESIVGPVDGLRAGEHVTLAAPRAGLPDLEITATPCRHGPPLSRPIVGEVVGFAVRRAGESRVALWASGDTVLYAGLRRAVGSLDIDVAIVNVGGVRFGLTGPLRYTMDGREAVELIALAAPRVAALAHYDGWSHFRDGEAGLRRAVDGARPEIRDRARWLVDGVAVEV